MWSIKLGPDQDMWALKVQKGHKVTHPSGKNGGIINVPMTRFSSAVLFMLLFICVTVSLYGRDSVFRTV